jgi:hypothetical protein
MPTISPELQDSGVTRIVGQGEDYAVDVVPGADGKNRIATDEQPLTGGISTRLTVGLTAVEAKVGASRYAGRRTISFMPLNGPIWYGFDTSVTSSNGRKVFRNQAVDLPIGNAPIYFASNEAGREVDLWEAK